MLILASVAMAGPGATEVPRGKVVDPPATAPKIEVAEGVTKATVEAATAKKPATIGTCTIGTCTKQATAYIVQQLTIDGQELPNAWIVSYRGACTFDNTTCQVCRSEDLRRDCASYVLEE